MKIIQFAFLGFILFSLISNPVLASSINIDEYVYSTGGQSSCNSQTGTDADKITAVWGPNAGVSKEWAGAQQIVIGPGRSTVQNNAEIGDGFTQNTVIGSTGQLAAWDTLSMTSLIPNESEIACTASEKVYNGDDTITSGATPSHVWADGQVGVMGSNGTYESDKTLDDSAYGLSGRYDGNGSFYGDLTVGSEAGNDKNSNILNHDDSIRRHVFGASAGRVSGKVDWLWSDYEDSLPVMYENETVTTNTTANQTAADEVANTTEEAV